MAKRKKKRTSIRTAAGITQKKFIERLGTLRDNPMIVYPQVVGDEAKPMRQVREGLEKVAAGKIGFRAKRDKGVVGAVVQSLPLADLEAAPRLLDHKVGGKRRFFMVRGQVIRGCMLGVQNHDDPLTLLMAYRHMAKEHKLHYWATDQLHCSGTNASPPEGWMDELSKRSGIEWQGDTDMDCGHDGDKVGLKFLNGPTLTACGDCLRKAGNLHALMKSRYAGPQERHPFDVFVVGRDAELDREMLAQVRGGIKSEAELL